MKISLDRLALHFGMLCGGYIIGRLIAHMLT